MSRPHRIYSAVEARALREAYAKPCRDCDGAGHYLCDACGDSSGEPCDAEDEHAVRHDDARHVRCDVCRGRGWVEPDDIGPVDSEMIVDLAATVERLEAARNAAHEAATRAEAEAARLAGELAIARLRPTRADVLAMLRAVVESYSGDDFYTDDVRSACAVAFDQLAAACGWEPLTKSEARL